MQVSPNRSKANMALLYSDTQITFVIIFVCISSLSYCFNDCSLTKDKRIWRAGSCETVMFYLLQKFISGQVSFGRGLTPSEILNLFYFNFNLIFNNNNKVWVSGRSKPAVTKHCVQKEKKKKEGGGKFWKQPAAVREIVKAEDLWQSGAWNPSADEWKSLVSN